MDVNLNVNAAAGNAASAPTVGAIAGRQAAASAPASTQDDAPAYSADALNQAVEGLRSLAQASHRNLDFSIDEGSGQTVVKVVASDTGEVIRQIPSEVALKLAQNLKDADGLLLNVEA
ncbi:flagellar protein FlaG [Pseudomonas sp. NPDC089407]|uniref:flagellar protein FlaG n=1 Tax=Pseudomonas sp. NPDC089407 TaxID=3364464 RepID=UPI00384D5B97